MRVCIQDSTRRRISKNSVIVWRDARLKSLAQSIDSWTRGGLEISSEKFFELVEAEVGVPDFDLEKEFRGA